MYMILLIHEMILRVRTSMIDTCDWFLPSLSGRVMIYFYMVYQDVLLLDTCQSLMFLPWVSFHELEESCTSFYNRPLIIWVLCELGNQSWHVLINHVKSVITRHDKPMTDFTWFIRTCHDWFYMVYQDVSWLILHGLSGRVMTDFTWFIRTWHDWFYKSVMARPDKPCKISHSTSW
jgi:hypothetical protein